MQFLADTVKISNRSSDNTISLTFQTGEYQTEEALEAFKLANNAIQQGKAIKVTIEVEDE